jgi:transcription initiation factor TFIIIB Brf1 subunit/transcription initiation factor TFIIB
MVEALSWEQMESIVWQEFEQLREKREPPKESTEFVCACGGVKSYQYEFPTCTECAVMDTHYLSSEPEWISGGPDENGGADMCRVGMPQNTILYSESWGIGTGMKGRNCQRMAKINFHSSMNHRDRALHHAYCEFQTVSAKLKIPDHITNHAKIIYRKFNEEKLTRGAIRLGIKANCLVWACKKEGVSRSTAEVAEAFGIAVRDLSRTSDMFREVTGEDLGESALAADIVKRIFNSVTCVPDDCRGRVRMRIINACRDAEQKPELLGKTPKGIVSAVVYKVLTELKYDVSRAIIADICGISVPTLVKIEKLIT